MANTKSRVPKVEKPDSLEAKVKRLLRALNDEWKGSIKGNRKAVDPRALLLLVKRFQALDGIIKDRKIPLFWYDGSDNLEDNPEVMRLYRGVNSSLRRYVATPTIMPEYLTDLETESRGWLFMWGRVGRSSQPFVEVGIAIDIIAIASMGRISSLKQCEQCRKWLFARFPHQRFCSDACKDEFHKFDPKDKERRRNWARENYRTRKTLEAGSASAANLRKVRSTGRKTK